MRGMAGACARCGARSKNKPSSLITMRWRLTLNPHLVIAHTRSAWKLTVR